MRALTDRQFGLAVGFSAAIPVGVALVRAARNSWTAEGDRAVVATRAYDVLTGESPLVGAWSVSSAISGEDTYSLGPLLYWLLALPARVSGELVLPTVMSVVSVACVLGIVAIAQRRGGRGLAVITGAAIALLWASLPPALPYDIWTASAPVLPFTLLVFACWSVACGDRWLLPIAVLLSAFVMQCHLAYVLPSLGLLVVAVVGAAFSGSPSPRGWIAMSLVVAVVCWSAPLADQILAWTGDEQALGNLTTVVEAGRDLGPTVGAAGGARAVAQAIGVDPWWLRSPPTAAERTFEVFASPPAIVTASAIAVLLALCAALVVAWRRRRRDVVAACGTALVLCLGLAGVTASFPNRPETIFSFSYASWWGAPAGMFAWLALGWSLWMLANDRVKRRLGARFLAIGPVGLVLVAALAAVSAVRSAQSYSGPPLHEAVRAVVQRLETSVPTPGSVRVRGPSAGFEAAIVYALRRRGARVETGLANQLGASYEVTGRSVERTLTVNDGPQLPARAQLIARVDVPPPTRRTITVGELPGPEAGR